jgi:xanthine dehydrogenase YagS FAD-binding subunit
MIPQFSYVRPQTLKETFKHLDAEGARLHAGGTDLLGCLHDQVFSASKIVSLSALSDLGGLSRKSNGGYRLGTLLPVAELAAHEDIQKSFPALSQAAASVASPQLRQQGTLGGNLCQKPRCWYYRGEFDCLRKGGATCYAYKGQNQFHCILAGSGCYIVHPSDTACALVALDAQVEIQGPGGKRTVAAEDFHVLPEDDFLKETVLDDQEILTAVLLPAPPQGQRSSYRKVRARQSWDFAVAGCALALTFEGDRVRRARIALSGAAPVPWRAQEAEAELKDRPLNADTAAKAAAAAMAKAEPLEHNGYKIELFKGLIEEELLKLTA